MKSYIKLMTGIIIISLLFYFRESSLWLIPYQIFIPCIKNVGKSIFENYELLLCFNIFMFLLGCLFGQKDKKSFNLDRSLKYDGIFLFKTIICSSKFKYPLVQWIHSIFIYMSLPIMIIVYFYIRLLVLMSLGSAQIGMEIRKKIIGTKV